MSNKIVIALNAPKEAGKDFAASIIKKHYGIDQQRFAKYVIDDVREAYGISEGVWNSLYTREDKDKPHLAFGGASPRKALIHQAESVRKPRDGKDYYARVACKEADELGDDKILFGDLGFTEEIDTLVKVFGARNILVIKIMNPVDRSKGDSRSYLSDGLLDAHGVMHKEVMNRRDSTFEEELLESLRDMLDK